LFAFKFSELLLKKGWDASFLALSKEKGEKGEIFVNFSNLHPKFNLLSLVVEKVYETLFHSCSDSES
jgi:hypothetical protein